MQFVAFSRLFSYKYGRRGWPTREARLGAIEIDAEFLQSLAGLIGCGKSTFCHPERSEGSAFLLGFPETADSSGKPRPSE
jgi:hypothetical protein